MVITTQIGHEETEVKKKSTIVSTYTCIAACVDSQHGPVVTLNGIIW